MARFPSRRAPKAVLARPGSARLQCIERLGTNRFEELNNYSGLMTRRKYDDSEGSLSAGGGDQRRRRLPPPPGPGAALDQAGDDQRGAEPHRLPEEDEAHNHGERASQRGKLVAAESALQPDADQVGDRYC